MSRVLLALCGLAMVLAGTAREPLQQIEGTVLAFAPGRSLTVVNEQTDPTGVEFPMRGMRLDTRDTLALGTRVKVWFRVVGERRPVVDRVRVVVD